jgi:hypothetical protein
MKRWRRSTAFGLALLAALALPACGSNPAGPSGPTQAVIRVTPSKGILSVSPLLAYNYRIEIDFAVVESAGVGASVNFIRLHLLARGTEVERQEIGSAAIIAQAGTNRLGASSTATLRTSFDFNDATTDTINYEMGFTDDKGHVLVASGPIAF